MLHVTSLKPEEKASVTSMLVKNLRDNSLCTAYGDKFEMVTDYLH